MLHQRARELGLDRVMDQEAGRRNAHLAGIAELGRAGGLDGQRHVGILGDDDRGMAAQFHRHAFHVRACQRRELLAHGRRAGEGHLADDRARDQVAGDLGRVAEDQADHARRQAGVDEALQQRRRRGWGFFGRLAQERATGGQGRGELAHDLVDREVPGRERGDRTDGLFQHQLLRCRIARRDDAAIDAHAFGREPVDDLGAGQRFAFGLGQRLALFLGQQARDVAGALAQQRRGAAHDDGALGGRHGAPGFEALLGGGQRAVQVGDAGVGHVADRLAGGRVDHGDGLAAGGVDPFVGDEQAGIGVAGGCHGVWVLW